MRDSSDRQNTLFKVLIASSTQSNAELLKKLLLKNSKFPICTEYINVSKIEKVHNKYTNIDVLLLYISSEINNGLDLLLKFKNLTSDTPIVVISEIDDDEIAITMLKAGAQDYLVKKNINSKALIRSLRHATERFSRILKLEHVRELEHYLAYHDALTKLPNRQLFEDRLNQAIAFGNRNSTSLAVLFLDLDGFKDINDTMGHTTGDEILKIIAKRLETCIRENETAARFGGDEFTICLQKVTGIQDIINVADRIHDVFSKSICINDKNFYVTTSIGISIYPDDGKDVETLIKNADIAMYRAKAKGKHTYQFYNASMNSNLSLRVKLINDLRDALKNNEFIIRYQPQVNIRTGQVTGIESIISWMHPELGTISADQFIPIAMETGMIFSIIQWILYKICSVNKKWQKTEMEKVRIIVHLSEDILRKRDLVNMIKKILQETNLSPQYLGLEITENSIIQKNNDTNLINSLSSLKEMGIQLSLGNFGTGYSSLYYLKNLPIDIIKIDSSFITNITNSSDDIAIIRAIIAVAHILGLKVIAEGVETEKQVLSLLNLGCDTIQGDYLSKPLSDIELANMLRRKLMVLIPEI